MPEEKPKDGFTTGLQDQECIEGDTVTLSCAVTRKGAKVKWFRDGKEIKPDGKKYEVVVDGLTHKLIIHDATLEDQVEFSAKFGDETTSCRLIVDGMYFQSFATVVLPTFDIAYANTITSTCLTLLKYCIYWGKSKRGLPLW